MRSASPSRNGAAVRFLRWLILLLVVIAVLIVGLLLAMHSQTPTHIDIHASSTRPAFITGISADIDSPLCISVDEKSLLITSVEEGTFPRGQALAYETRLLVDRQVMPPDPSTNLSLMKHYEYSDDWELIGSHGGWANYCYGIDPVRKGTHTATFNITTPSGKIYSYQWDFTAR
jgi:hypothetical protein